MRHRLPSLNALRAFEAAARHGGVSAASRELNVTPGAISRQIGLLEAHFGCRFFVRHRRGLQLTDKGRQYFAAISDAFDRIDAATVKLAEPGSASRLSVRALTTFATEWLIPRIADFRALHPEIDFRLDASLTSVDFDCDDVDICVTDFEASAVNAAEGRRSLHCDRLFLPIFFPVCSPELLRSGPPLETPQDLSRHTLLYSQIQVPNWLAWLKAADVRGIDPGAGLRFENSSLSFRAAREGAGVALGQRLFLTDDLESGRLVAPFDLTLEGGRTYFLVCPETRAKEPAIVAFRNWLIAQIGATDAQASGGLPRPGRPASVTA